VGAQQDTANPSRSAILTVAVLDADAKEDWPSWVEPLRSHLREVEPSLSVHWIALAGPGKTNAYDTFDDVIRTRNARDHGQRLNLLVASVRSPYVFWADRGWRFDLPGGRPFCRLSIDALERTGLWAQVKLHTDDNLRFTDRSVYGGPLLELGGASFFIQSPRKIWGGITLLPAITKLQALHELGPFREGPGLDYEDVAAEYCARSTEEERQLVLRSPELAPFSPVSADAYVSEELIIEAP
jgi:hypothetical protein